MGSRETGSPVSLLVKYVLFFLNFAIFLLAIAVVCLMVWVLDVKEKKVNTVYDFVLDPACMLCLIGCIAVVISKFGWIGALRESTRALTIYRYLMMTFFLFELVAIILIFVIVYVPESRSQFGIYPEDALTQAIVKYRDDEDMQNLIDSIQQLLECCGVSNDDEGYKDWTKNAYFNCTAENEDTEFGEFCNVPFSCCKQTDTGLVNFMCGKDMQSSKLVNDAVRMSTINTKGCFKAMSDTLQNNILVAGAITIGILIPQMLLTSLTSRLTYQIEQQRAKWYRPQVR